MAGNKKDEIDFTIGVSSGCFLVNGLEDIIAISKKIGITTVELGANVQYVSMIDIPKIIKGSKGIQFLIHHYFPAPEEPFVCNIAHPDTVVQSCEFIKRSIRLCSALDLPYYSIHAGYGINPAPLQLGKNQSHLVPVLYEKSLELFVNSATELENYGKKFGVELLWENNVVANCNIFETKRTPYLFADLEFLKEMENDSWWKKAKLLLDIGHLKVSSGTLKFSREEFIDRIKDKVVHIHLSDNNGLTDSNKPLTEDAFFMLRKIYEFTRLETLILEVHNITAQKIREQVGLIKDAITQLCSINKRV